MSEKKVPYKKVKNHSGHAEEHEEGEPWLLSYADMVTLLMCFFILFFSIDKTKGGISDPERLKQKLESIITVELAAQMQTESQKAKSQQSGSSGSQSVAKKMSRKIKDDLRAISKAAKIVFALSTPEPGVMEITFLNADFFDPGKATLTPSGQSTVAGIAPRLKSIDEKATISIEGHTDQDVIKHSIFGSNWELSSARASAIAKLLANEGVDPKRMMVAGFGEHRPILPEVNEFGKSDPIAKKMNRRVVIRVHFPKPFSDDENEQGQGGDSDINSSSSPKNAPTQQNPPLNQPKEIHP